MRRSFTRIWSSYGTQQDSAHRLGHDRRHARPSDRPEGTGRRGSVRHCGRPAPGQRPRHRAIRSGGRFRCEVPGRQRLCRYRRLGCLYRDRRCAAQAGHEPRRPSRHQSEGDGTGRRRHQEICAERFCDLHHQPARRDGMGAAEILRPAEDTCGGHGWRAGLLALPAFPRRRVQRVDRGRQRDDVWAAMATTWCRWCATPPWPACRCRT